MVAAAGVMQQQQQPGAQSGMQVGVQPGGFIPMQPGMQPLMHGGVQYMPVILLAKQAMQLSQSGQVVPVQNVGPMEGAQMQGMMLQQQQQGKGGGQYGVQGGQNFHNKSFNKPHANTVAATNDDDMEDWLSRRMKNKGDAAPNSRKAQQHGQLHAQHGHDQMQRQMVQHQQTPEQLPQQQQQMQHQMRMQMPQYQHPQSQLEMQQQQQRQQPQMQQQFQQEQFQQQQQQHWMWQQQGWQWQHESQSHWGNSRDDGKGKGKAKGKNAKGSDSPRTAAWRDAMAKATGGSLDVDEWASRRSEALAHGPVHRAKPAAPEGNRAAVGEASEESMCHQPVVDFQELGKVFADARPWADIADERGDFDELEQMVKQAEECHMSKGDVPNIPEDSEGTKVSEDSTAHQTEAVENEHAPPVAAAPPAVEPASLPKGAAAPSLWAAKAAATANALPTRGRAPANLPAAAAKRGPAATANAASGTTGSAGEPVASASLAEASSTPKAAVTILTATPEQAEAAPAATSAPAAAEKRRKALQKKLKQIEDLEDKQKNGVTLDKDQQQKLASRAAIEEELRQLA